MKRKEHIIRTSKLIQALLMGYEVTLPQYIISYKRPNFYYKAECDGEPCFVKYVDLTLSSFEHIAKEMSEQEYFKLTTFIAMNKDNPIFEEESTEVNLPLKGVSS